MGFNYLLFRFMRPPLMKINAFSGDFLHYESFLIFPFFSFKLRVIFYLFQRNAKAAENEGDFIRRDIK